MAPRKNFSIARPVLRPAVIRLCDWLTGEKGGPPPETRIARCRATLSGEVRNPAHPVGRMTALFHDLRIVADEAEQDRLLNDLATAQTDLRVGFVNAHAINLAWRDPDSWRAFADLDVLLRDGIGMKIALRAIDAPPGLNMNGTDLIPKILAACRTDRIAIFGTEEPWLGRAANVLRGQGMRVVDTHHGFDPLESYGDRLARTPAELVLLAMGMPKQEIIAGQLSADGRRVILCGGAIVDFMAERYPRAPAWMRRFNLEWLFRLWREPVRLFDRYVVGNGAFLLRTAFLPGRWPARMALAVMDWLQEDGEQQRN